MTLRNFVSTAFLPRIGIYQKCFQKNVSSISFGNPQMSDKLYKNIELEIKSYEPAVMRSYEHFIKTAAQHLNVTIEGVVSKKKPDHHRINLLKSAFVHGKHRIQYEVRTYYTRIQLKHLTGSTADTFLEYVERMLPEGLALKVTKLLVEPAPEHLNPKTIKEGMKVVS